MGYLNKYNRYLPGSRSRLNGGEKRPAVWGSCPSPATFLLALALAAGLLLTPFAGYCTSGISLLPEAEVRGSAIRLGELVAPRDQKLLPAGLAGLELGPAPLPGTRRVLDGEHIHARVRQAGFDSRLIHLDATPKVSVLRSSQTVTRQEMSGWVRRYLADQTRGAAIAPEIAGIRIGQDLVLPAGQLSHTIVPPKNQTLSGKVPLAIHCYVDGREQKRVWAMVKIVRRAQVVVARKPLRRHKVIEADDIKLVAVDLAQLPSGVITNPDEILGQRTQRKIDPNTVLRTGLVELPPLVKRKDVVVILAEAPGLSITTLGEAQESGRLGQLIRVTNLDSRQRIFARVVDATTVRVDF